MTASSIRSASERARPWAVALALALTGTSLAGNGLAEAKAAVAQARQAFDLGKFDQALAKYEEAYTLHPAPGLLFNLGQCHRQMGHAERALYFFRRYLESKPTGPQATATRELIAKLEQTVALEKEKARESQGTAQQLELEKTRLAAAQAEAAERRAAEKRALDAALTAPPPPPVVEEVPLTRRWWFWTAVGVVAAGAGAAIYVGTAPQPTPTSFPDINAR